MAKDELQRRYEVANGNFVLLEYMADVEIEAAIERLKREARADLQHAKRLLTFGRQKFPQLSTPFDEAELARRVAESHADDDDPLQ